MDYSLVIRTKTRKVTLVGIMIALGVALAPFSIPLGSARVFPIQHLLNVLAAVLLGPVWATMMAFGISLIRVATGTGTLLAFPGSMIGALLAGLMHLAFFNRCKYVIRFWPAFVGEVIGTGILGALIAYPVAVFLMGKTAALFTYIIPFMASTGIGAGIALLVLNALSRSNLLSRLNQHQG